MHFIVYVIGPNFQAAIPKRPASEILSPFAAYLPVKPASRLKEALVAQCTVERNFSPGLHFGRCDHGGEHIVELLIEVALDQIDQTAFKRDPAA